MIRRSRFIGGILDGRKLRLRRRPAVVYVISSDRREEYRWLMGAYRLVGEHFNGEGVAQ